jgi:hypothetical protein
MMPMGYPPMMGAPSPFYNPFMSPAWPFPQTSLIGHAGHGLAGLGVEVPAMAANNSAPSVATGTPAADADITFPDVGDWARYCDTIPKRDRIKLGKLSKKLDDQGFFEIDQLTGDRISHSDLSTALGIGLGVAALIVKYAEEDVAQVRAGTFNMNLV